MTFDRHNCVKCSASGGASIWKFGAAVVALVLAVAVPAFAQAKKPAQPQSAREHVDLLVTARYVVTMDATGRVLENGAIAGRGDAIIAVGPSIGDARPD
jgi:hypothetical protein